MAKTAVQFGEWRPDIALLDNQLSAIAENVFAGANTYLPFPGLAALTTASLTDGGNNSSTKVLIPFSGADASTTFTDTNVGGSAHTWAAAGNAQIDTAQSVFGGTSGLFDGTGDWITTADHADFTFGSGNFTIDLRAEPNTTGALLYICGQGNSTLTAATTSFYISRTAANKVEAGVSNGSAFTTLLGTSTTFTSGFWRAIRLERYGNTLTLYMDGVVEATASFSGAVNDSANAFRIGAAGEVTTTPWNGWIDEFRLHSAATSYGAAYTPATVPFFLGGTVCGLTIARTATGSFKIYAGTTTRLFSWSSVGWTDVSRTTGGNYSVATGDQWTWQQNNTKLIASHIGDDAQEIDIDSGTNFAALAGSPPRARQVKQIGPHTFLAGWASNQRKLQWSATENRTGWTVGTSLSDDQEMPDGGPIQGVAGNETIGYIVQDRAIRALQYLPGDTTLVFNITKVLEERGSVSKYGFIVISNVLFFLAEDGFYSLAGQQLTPIGADKVNEWFLANSDPARRNVVQAVSWPNKPWVGWAYHGSATATTYNKMIILNLINGRWTSATISAQIWAALASTGLDLDTTGGDPGDALADSSAPSLDSYGYVGGRPVLGAVDPNGILSFQTGANLAATIETAEAHLVPGGRAFVSEVYPLIDAPNALVAVGTRETLQDSVSWDTAVPLEVTGSASILSSARLHSFRVTTPAGETWTKAQGVVIDGQPDGEG